MNIHLPAILGFTRYQGFDPSPYIYIYIYVKSLWWTAEGPEMRQETLWLTLSRLKGEGEWHGTISATPGQTAKNRPGRTPPQKNISINININIYIYIKCSVYIYRYKYIYINTSKNKYVYKYIYINIYTSDEASFKGSKQSAKAPQMAWIMAIGVPYHFNIIYWMWVHFGHHRWICVTKFIYVHKDSSFWPSGC
jgi:hypothetical protein